MLLQGITRRLGIEPDEARLLALMGALVATLFGAYTIAKVLRDALFLSEFGALALPYMYIGVAVAAAGFVWLEGGVTKRFSRLVATRFNQCAAIAFSALAALLLPLSRHWTIAIFYVWTGSQAMMILPHFWALALDVWDSRRARSIFPLLGGCGLLGGLLGGGLAAWTSSGLGSVGLMWVLTGCLVLAFALTRLVERQRARGPTPVEPISSTSSWKIVLRSPYIKILVLALALSVIVSTLVDFQFKIFVQRTYPDPHALTAFFGKYYVGLNALSLLFQFTVAGWVMRRLGLGPATALQPVSGMLFTAFIALSPLWWAVLGLKWIQGVVFGALGKSSAEIYYTAVHPRERRRIKAAIDTLVERWSDAVVGLLLIVVLHTVGMKPVAIAVLTATLAVGWLVALFFLNRQYGRAFEQVLSSHWIEPATAPEAIRTPSARKALLAALHADDEHRIVLALHLSHAAHEGDIAAAARECLHHASPAVRAAAVEAMRAMRLPDLDAAIEGFLAEPNENVRRAAVDYLLAWSTDPTAFADRLLTGDDETLRQHVVDALQSLPGIAATALTPAWFAARVAAGSRADLLLAARAAGAMAGPGSVERLQSVLASTDAEVQRVALVSARRRPDAALLPTLLPLFVAPGLSQEARDAVAAIGDAAVPALARMFEGEHAARAQALAARTLGRIATPHALAALMALVRTSDARLRYLGLQNLSRARADRRAPVVTRQAAHKLFLRELADYRKNAEPAAGLAAHAAPEVRLFAASFGESADMALERALSALACWYDTRPLAGAFRQLRARDPKAAAPALEYLGHVLPRAVFRPVTRLFEGGPVAPAEPDAAAAESALTAAIEAAWRWGDGWLRACAVRASRFAPSLDATLFKSGDADDPLVAAELAWLANAGASC